MFECAKDYGQKHMFSLDKIKQQQIRHNTKQAKHNKFIKRE